MSKYKNKLTILLLTAAICTSAIPALAADVNVSANDTAVTTAASQTFTIDEAIAYAKKNSRTLAAYKAAESTAKAQKEETKKLSRDTREQIFKSEMASSSDSTYLVLTGYTYRATLLGYAAAQRATIEQEYLLESNVKSAFYSYLNNAELVDIAKSSLDSSKERLTQAELKYKSGLISQLDLDNFTIAVNTAQASYTSAVRTKDLSMIQLKSTLNYPQENELNVVGSFECPPMDTTTPEEALKKAENSIAYVNTKENLDLAKFKLEKSIAHYTSSSLGAKTARAEYAQAELDYYNTMDTLRINVYSLYNGVASAYENLEILKQTIDLYEKNAQKLKLTFELGLATSNDYISLVQELDSLKNQYASLELSAYIANEKYKVFYDCPNTISQEDPSL